MSPELGVLVLAAIFAAGVALVALVLVALLPGVTVLDGWIETLRRRRSGDVDDS